MLEQKGSPRAGWTIFYLFLALAVPLTFVLVTHNIWEDFLITFRHSVNLVEGRGLVFNPSRLQRIQGFTSCLNVMLSAIFYAISNRSAWAAINLYRLVCLTAFVSGGYVLLRLMLSHRREGDWLSPLVFILLFVTEAKTVMFTMNGQESALMVAFLSVGFVAAYKGLGRHWRLAAMGFAGLLYTRPDAPVYIAALILAGIVFGIEKPRPLFKGIGKATAVAAILFSPWFSFVWVYYGNPIPNTLLAKSNFHAANLFAPVQTTWTVLTYYPLAATNAFLPLFLRLECTYTGWPRILQFYALACATLCTMYWLIPSEDRLGRMASFLFVMTSLYLAFVGAFSMFIFPWYYPAVSVFGTITLSRSVSRLRMPAGVLRISLVAACFCVTVTSALLMAAQTYHTRIQQREIADGLMKPLGQFLRENAKDGHVYSEGLGYVGYYSQCFIVDYPGLVTPEVMKLKRNEHAGFVTIITKLKPEWLVIRPGPLAELTSEVAGQYSVAKRFDVTDKLNRYGYIPGRDYLDDDAVYYVMRRNDIETAQQIPTSQISPQ